MELSKIKEILKKELPLTNIKFEEPMNLHTSFKIGGIADVFITANNIEEVKKILDISKEKLLNMDFIKAIKEIKNIKFDIVYLDPPYKTDFIKTAIKELIETEVLTEETLIIAETDEEERITKQIEEFKGIEIVDKRKYGRAYVLFLKKMNGKEE